MGRELQKKKNKSSNPKIKQKPKSKRVNPLGNPIIAANWDQKQTLTQNYARLGLTSRLNTATGGIEKLRPGKASTTSTINKLAISNAIPKNFTPEEARVERDPETGKILRVIHSKQRFNPLNDPLNSDSEDEYMDLDGDNEAEVDEEAKAGNIVRELERQARTGGKKVKERVQSEREKEWCERLATRWGEDYHNMARDRRLNPMQQTEPDIRRRIEKWKAAGGASSEVKA
ncbi:putative nucleolar protein 16 [Calycina marina]|uniref:Nucleolar protein 16 n=1 Tax=Calycina marina TaxID=1763456 RepID=A0A9P8CIB6_9HELO|nr:putative nucleolar protein 16 [Calycina marina]